MTRFRTETGRRDGIGRHPRRPRTPARRQRRPEAAAGRHAGARIRDQLTGLFSRHYLTDYLEQEIERMSGEANIVLSPCAISTTSSSSTTCAAHQAGDIAIVCIADILDDLSGNHPVIRWGGEELLLVLFSTPDHEALRLCNQMREAASYPISDDLGVFSCTLTFGLSAYDPNSRSARTSHRPTARCTTARRRARTGACSRNRTR